MRALLLGPAVRIRYSLRIGAALMLGMSFLTGQLKDDHRAADRGKIPALEPE